MSELNRLMSQLCNGLDTDSVPDGDLFMIRLQEEWLRRRSESLDLFEERQDLLLAEWRTDLALFEALLDLMAALELWEFCAILRDKLTDWSIQG